MMAKNMSKIMVLCLAFLLSIGMIAMQAMASSNSEAGTAAAEEPANFSPIVAVIKTADKEAYEQGETIDWTITVKNTSDFTAYDVIVEDEVTGAFWFIEALRPGSELSFATSTENVQAGSFRNTATVTWEDGDELIDEEETRSSSHEVTVTVRGQAPSAPVIPQNPTPGVSAGGEIEILDEELPLAAAPKTGDISVIWIMLSGISAGGMALLRSRRKEEAE